MADLFIRNVKATAGCLLANLFTRDIKSTFDWLIYLRVGYKSQKLSSFLCFPTITPRKPLRCLKSNCRSLIRLCAGNACRPLSTSWNLIWELSNIRLALLYCYITWPMQTRPTLPYQLLTVKVFTKKPTKTSISNKWGIFCSLPKERWLPSERSGFKCPRSNMEQLSLTSLYKGRLAHY